MDRRSRRLGRERENARSEPASTMPRPVRREWLPGPSPGFSPALRAKQSDNLEFTFSQLDSLPSVLFAANDGR